MKERPILWSAPMVQALLAGRKTQTRRVAKFEFLPGQNPDFGGYSPGNYMTGRPESGYVLHSRGAGGCWNDRTEPLKPYALVGDRLWGRETFVYREKHDRYYYRADSKYDPYAHNGWKPSIFMPRKACRLLHEVTAVRVERLQEISEADAIAEGVEWVAPTWGVQGVATSWGASPVLAYRQLWESINGAGSWESNPWVWVVSIRPVSP